jgi:hypothetical protein
MRCVGCGDLLPPGGAACPRCRAPALGAAFQESVELPLDGPFLPPTLCCCCLGRADFMRNEKVSVGALEVKGGALQKQYVRVPVPWCRKCRNRRTHLFVATLTTFITASIGVIYLIACIRHGEMSTPFHLAGVAIGGGSWPAWSVRA